MLRFETHGAQRMGFAALHALPELEAVLPDAAGKAGIRLHNIPALARLLAPQAPIGRLAARACGRSCEPVRAILFDKNRARNWALGWHQDRTIAVAARQNAPGFGPWTVKAGMVHVEPPIEIIASMITLRIHLDPVASTNAPLLVSPGSHRFGRVADGDVAAIVARCGTESCEAEAGDIWLYRTAILHASRAAEKPERRRVLQVDYAPRDLPDGLRWLGV